MGRPKFAIVIGHSPRGFSGPIGWDMMSACKVYHHHQSLLPPVAHGTVTMSLFHWVLSLAIACASPHDKPISLHSVVFMYHRTLNDSLSMVLLHKHQWNTRWAFGCKHDIFACGNNMLFSQVKSTLMCCCTIETSSVQPWKSLVVITNLRQPSEIFGKCLKTFCWPSTTFWDSLENHH